MKAHWSSWSENWERDVFAADEALALLAEVNTQQPALVEFYNPDTGNALAVGVGRQDTVFTYQASLDPPYFVSAAEGETAADDVVVFCYNNEANEYLLRNVVPKTLVPLVVRQFFAAPTALPTGVKWELL